MEYTNIKMRNNSAIYNIETAGIFVMPGSFCIAETEHGVDYGEVLASVPQCKSHECETRGKLLRLATDDDKLQIAQLEDLEKRAFTECRAKSAEKKLEMTLVNVKAVFDRSKIIFYFVAENRVDFRELVRDLAGIFRTRIEMRQIGVRDKARMMGGYGTCGERLCCTKFRGVFSPVSIKMAKEQNLNLNSQKISGCCGRLLCCLDYEYQVYRELNEGPPQHGSEIIAGDSRCTVEAVDTLKETIRIKYKDAHVHIHKKDLTVNGSMYCASAKVIEDIIHHAEQDHSEQE